MPDLQTELSKLANAWDNHEQIIRKPQQEKAMKTTITGNASKDTFTLIKDYPHVYTHNTAAQKMVDAGYKKNSVHSLITQMKKAGIFNATDDGTLYTTQPEYKPFANPYKTNSAGRKAKAKPVKQIRQTSAGIAALQVVDTPVRTAPTQWDAETVLAHIGIKEAHKLYLELNTYFGGVK